MAQKTFSYITVLSNWLLGYDRYRKIYSKQFLNKSTYPNEFYLLKDSDFSIGINKAKSLLERLAVENNLIVRIESTIESDLVKKNTRNGLGWILPQNFIEVNDVFIFVDNEWIKTSVEEITALAYKLQYSNLLSYNQLAPRSLSILPVAKACQANCAFCFSESSISFDQEKHKIDWESLEYWCASAKESGAERFVITGGGEPGLLKFADLCKLIQIAKKYFAKVVLISNGMFLSKHSEGEVVERVNSLIEAGLTVLSFSYHAFSEENNKRIMGVDTGLTYLLSILSKHKYEEKLTLRLICVLQKAGIYNETTISKYLDWATKFSISQICFKELYVSSTQESLYAKTKENEYSLINQVSLKFILDYVEKFNFKLVMTLPWGSPVFEGFHAGKKIQVAAYTEPSVGWERHNGIARSWNIMSDGKCYVTLEDKDSELEKK